MKVTFYYGYTQVIFWISIFLSSCAETKYGNKLRKNVPHSHIGFGKTVTDNRKFTFLVYLHVIKCNIFWLKIYVLYLQKYIII